MSPATKTNMTSYTLQQKDENDNNDESITPNSMIETTSTAAVTTTKVQPSNVVVGNRRSTSSLGLTSSVQGGQGNGAGGDVSSPSLSSSIRLKKSDSFQLHKTESYKLAKKRNRDQQIHTQNQQQHTNTTTAPSAAATRPPAQLAYVRDVDSAKPMGWDDRFMLSIRRKLGIDDGVGRAGWDSNFDGEENSDGSYVLPGMIGHDSDKKLATTDSTERKKKNFNINSPHHRKKESMPNINLVNDPNLRKQLQLHKRNKSMSVIMIEDTKCTNSESCINFKEDEELGHECANSIQLYQQLQRNHRKKQSLTSIISDNADVNDYNSNSNNIDDEIGRRTGSNSSSSMATQPFTQMKLHRKKQSLTSIVVADADRDSNNSNNDRRKDCSNKEEEQELVFGHSSTCSNLDTFPIVSTTTNVLVPKLPTAHATESDSIDNKNNPNLDGCEILEAVSGSGSRGDSNYKCTKQALHDSDEVGYNYENNSTPGTSGTFAGKDNGRRDIKSRRVNNRQQQHESPTIRDNMAMQQPQSTIGILVDKLLQRQTSTSNSNRTILSKKKNDGDFDNDDEYNNNNQADSLHFATLVDANDDRADRPNTNSTTTAAVVFPNKLNQNDMNTMGPAGVLRRFFHWTFRVYFGILFFLMALCFFIIVIMFAFVFMTLLHFEPDCLSIIGKHPYGNTGAYFSDAFYLSWTTFSTVGYGTAAVALSYQNDSPNNCAFVTIVASLEALSGTLFTGVCGAILFGKVLRILSHAQVVFSDPILIRYGVGAREVSNEDDNEGEDENNKYEQLPFPVLEFRIINRLNDEDGGEIVDASVQVVAKIDHEDKVYENDLFNDSHDDCNYMSNTEESEHLDRDIKRIEEMNARNEMSQTPVISRNAVHIGRLWFDRMRDKHKCLGDDFDPDDDNKNVFSSDSTISNRNPARMGNSLPPNQSSYSNDIEKRRASFSLPLSPFARAAAQPSTSFLSARTTSNGSMNRSARNLIRSTITANGTARRNIGANTAAQQQQPKTMSHQQYYKLNVETPEHPFFKRVWIVRHVLDNSSPIVKQRVKSKIKRNNGYWPYKELNTYTDIIKSLQFNHIIVSLNGVSNISASTVYAQKIYDFEDVKVGYQFANVLYRDQDTGKLKVDLDLINDVRVQRGGGNEPLWVEEGDDSDDDDDEEEVLDIVDKCEIIIEGVKIKEHGDTAGNKKRIDTTDTVGNNNNNNKCQSDDDDSMDLEDIL